MSFKEAPFAVIICHDSFHTPEPYQPFLAALKAQGIEGYCPQLPTSDIRKLNPNDDAIVVKELLTKLLEKEGKKFVLTGHFAGGFTVTLAAVPEYQARRRRAYGKSGGILGIFYECGFLAGMGESMSDFLQPNPLEPQEIPPFSQFHKQGVNGLVTVKEGAKYFFNDLDDAAAERYAATLTASPVSSTLLDNDAYTALPLAYLYAQEDLILTKQQQEDMVLNQKVRGGVDMTLYSSPARHSPHLSWTKELVSKVLEFGKKAVIALEQEGLFASSLFRSKTKTGRRPQ